jgi:hypothetical protein
MASAQAGRRVGSVLATLGLVLAVAPSARAIEAFDGRIQAHGFFEAQVRALDSDFSQEIDLSQWYNVFNLEIETDVLPDGWGPFDLLQTYVRVEARYDAIYNNGMWLFPSVETFGDSSKRLPKRLRDALDQDYGGAINANAQADPPGDKVFRVPNAGDLPGEGVARYQHPRGDLDPPRYHERDPVGWAIEAVVEPERLDWARDQGGMFIPDPKNPMDPNDLVFVYRTQRSRQLLANLTPAEIAQQAALDDPAVLLRASTFQLDPAGDLVLDPSGQPIVACGQMRPDGSGEILCRALPAPGGASTTNPNNPALPGGNTGFTAGAGGKGYQRLLDLGNTEVTDPLTGETATMAELYGDVRFQDSDGDTVPDRDADGNLIWDTSTFAGGESITGFGTRIQGAASTTNPERSTLPPAGSGVLVGVNATCPTNRSDTRNPYAIDGNTGQLEFSDEERRQMLASGKQGTCLDNRPEKIEIVKRRAFPGFDTLFDQEGADAQLGVNPDAADPNLTNRSSPVSELRAQVDEILVANGFNTIEDGGLNGVPQLDKPGFDAEQEALNEFAPYFRGIARERDDPAFYALENVIDWRFTTREVKGSVGGGGSTLLMGPWLPKNFFKTAATLSDRANPFRARQTPTLVARLSSGDYGVTDPDAVGFQTPRASGDRYTDLDVEATQRLLDENGFIRLGNPASRFIPDDGCPPGPAGTGCKIIATVPDPDSPGDTIQALVGLDFTNARFLPEPIDPKIDRVNQLVSLLGEAGLRLRRQRDRGTVGNPRGQPSQAAVGPYPNDVLQQADEQANFGFRFAGTRFNFDIPLLQRSGAAFGGDWSGILPCVNTIRSVTRTTSPALSSLEARLAGFQFGVTEGTNLGCIPFTNVLATGGTGELPMRPATDMSNLMTGLPGEIGQGNYIPSQGYIQALQEFDFDNPEFNINQNERSWNRGASQSDTFEVKEAYADMEFLDSRLWVRFGLQNIVWGKTELFRTTDQFNPQDLALASLPSLEESRIALLSGRAVYSLYTVGPLEDVRLELAANFDRYKPADLGACGEPYTIDIVCALTTGFAFHGITGIGVAGVDRPPNAWDDIDGVEFGGRVEFRWDRFSIAIVDFYGYSDFPYVNQITSYFHSVDTATGRPLKAFGQSPCENAGGYVDRVPQRGFPGAAPNYTTFSAGNPRLAEEVDFEARRALVQPQGDPTALPTGTSTPNPLDDWVKHPIAYTIQGIGIDPGCLKPGGIAGKPNENRFDTALAPDQPLELVREDPDDPNSPVVGIDTNGDGVADYTEYASADFADPEAFNNSTLGQWRLEGSSVDDSLEWHPANQQLFSVICLGTVSIVAALDPGACAWSIFGSGAPLVPGVIDIPLSEVLTLFLSGDRSDDTLGFQGLIIGNTKSTENQFGNVFPLVSLNRDARDGLTTAVDPRITGSDPFNPGDLDDLLTLGNTLSAQQQALLGCGPFYGTRCDSGRFYSSELEAAQAIEQILRGETPRSPPPARPSPRNRVLPTQPPPAVFDTPGLEFPVGNGGIDVLNTEASAILQSVPGLEGTGSVKGTYTKLVRNADGSLQRAGDGMVDAATQYGVDPALLNGNGTRFTVPAGYLAELDQLDALNAGLGTLQDNPAGVARLGDAGCPAPSPLVDPTCPGLTQISNAIEELNQKAIDGTITPAEETLRQSLSDPNSGQFDRQNLRINSNVNGQTTLIKNQEQTVGSATTNLLNSFRIGGNNPGDPSNVDRSAFGRTRQEFADTLTGEPCDPADPDPDNTCRPVQVPIAGNVVDGLEEFGPVNDWVTWSNAPQPGTLGNAGLAQIDRSYVLGPGGAPVLAPDGTGQFATTVDSAAVVEDPNPYVGGEYCTRYDPESPYADASGIVRLPGCRGALSVSVNTEPPPTFAGVVGVNVYNIDQPYDGTVEVVFEDFYDPRVDGCIFGPTLNSRSNLQTGEPGKVYKVQAVNPDGTLDNYTQALLEDTCFNQALDGVRSTTQFPGTPFAFQAIDPDTDLDANGNPILLLNGDGSTQFSASTHRRRDNELLEYVGVGNALDSSPQAFSATLWHPWASCLQSSALFGSANTGLSYAYPEGGSAVGRSRAWAVDGAAPLTRRLPQTRQIAIVPDEDGNFQVDAGVGTNVADAEDFSDAAGSRASFLCDVRTRDFENDFFEGVLVQDLDGDGLIASGAQVFRSEMAAVSWNVLMFLTSSSCNATSGGDDLADLDCFRPSTPWALGRCSFSQPEFCRNVKGFLSVAGLRRNDVRAGGNGSFGRRDFIWHSGGEVVLQYARRNVFGLSADFAEDVTKTNWSLEFTWIGATPFFDNNAYDSTTSSQAFNLTVSVDRPTFINFLNANRTFFMNSQWFFQYLTNYNSAFFTSGPFNVLFTFAVFTGYYQDRLLPQVVTVYDFRSQSGGFLPQISYRFTESFSITLGVSFFIGRGERIVMPVNGIAPTQNRAGPHAYQDGTERLLSLIRNRDEAFMRIRWTF